MFRPAATFSIRTPAPVFKCTVLDSSWKLVWLQDILLKLQIWKQDTGIVDTALIMWMQVSSITQNIHIYLINIRLSTKISSILLYVFHLYDCPKLLHVWLFTSVAFDLGSVINVNKIKITEITYKLDSNHLSQESCLLQRIPANLESISIRSSVTGVCSSLWAVDDSCLSGWWRRNEKTDLLWFCKS